MGVPGECAPGFGEGESKDPQTHSSPVWGGGEGPAPMHLSRGSQGVAREPSQLAILQAQLRSLSSFSGNCSAISSLAPDASLHSAHL